MTAEEILQNMLVGDGKVGIQSSFSEDIRSNSATTGVRCTISRKLYNELMKRFWPITNKINELEDDLNDLADLTGCDKTGIWSLVLKHIKEIKELSKNE